MIIWLNGPYGVGKSTLARAVQRKLKNTMIFDAEKVGDAIRDSYPEEFFWEFYEDYPIWCETCGKMLLDLHQKTGKTILVPMTLLRPNSVRNILEMLRNQGAAVIHVLLTAEPETLHDRILARGEKENCWCMEKIPQCLIEQKNLSCDLRIDTTNQSVEQLADQILKNLEAERNHPAAIHIRRAVASDYERVETIMQEVQQLHIHWRPDIYKPAEPVYGREYYEKLVSENRLLVAEQEGTVVGLLSFLYRHVESDKQVTRDIIFVDELAVKEEYRGQGIGSRLLDEVRNKVQAEHLDGLELQVNARNTAARRMYEKLGFTEKSINLELLDPKIL